ncbi:MAG: aminoacyl-tRNA hydrolase [Bacillota bacterium]|nr:aminoacyl-tRNA hydrolase [Bacillota bacterium]
MSIFFKSKESETSDFPTYIVAGLGNPGDKYLFTRHNTGFMFIDYCSEKYGCKINKLKHKALVGELRLPDKKVLFLKPQTYMNNSGEAVREAADFYKVPPSRIIAVSDDTTLDVGVLRIRPKGSDGGQKGLRSIIEHLGTSDFVRIRIGIGQKPHPDYDLADWVLSEFSNSEKKTLFETLTRASEALNIILDGNVALAMSRYNG